MQTVPLSAFFPTVIGIAPTVSEQYASHFIKEAVIEAAKRTRSIVHQDPIDAQKGVSEYALPVRDGYSMVSVQQVSVLGTCYEPSRDKPCPQPYREPECQPELACSKTLGCKPKEDCCYVTSESEYQSDCIQSRGVFYVDSKRSIIIDPPPQRDLNDGIIVTMSVAPSRYSCDVPEEFWEEWSLDIAYGALSMIHLQMNTKHYSPQQAMLFSNKWSQSLKRMRGSRFIANVEGDEKIISHARLI